MKEFMDNAKLWLDDHPLTTDILVITGVLILAWLVYLLSRKLLVKWAEKIFTTLAKKTKTSFDDIVLKKLPLKRLALIPPAMVFFLLNGFFPDFAYLINRFVQAFVTFILVITIHAFLSAVIEYTEVEKKFKGKPIKGYIQILIILIYVAGGLIITGVLTGQSPLLLLSSIGALTAVLLLIFKETILALIASLQISSYDLIKKGDWIEAKSFGADGDVMDISLHTVKVQNFDKTITVIPTHKLIDGSFKNWKGMQESGGRRIKRSINIDIASVKFCTDEEIERFRKIDILTPYIEEKLPELDNFNKELKADLTQPSNGRRLTNIGTFRAYISAYLKQKQEISDDMTFLIRQLAPSPTGIPLEIYVFTKTTAWGEYEAIQADIFDHLMAVVKEFDLKIYQFRNRAPNEEY